MQEDLRICFEAPEDEQEPGGNRASADTYTASQHIVVRRSMAGLRDGVKDRAGNFVESTRKAVTLGKSQREQMVSVLLHLGEMPLGEALARCSSVVTARPARQRHQGARAAKALLQHRDTEAEFAADRPACDAFRTRSGAHKIPEKHPVQSHSNLWVEWAKSDATLAPLSGALIATQVSFLLFLERRGLHR
jgi:hypothetical protein